jgi:hypothetical protein
LSPAGSGAEDLFAKGAEKVDKYIQEQEGNYKKSLGGTEPGFDVGRTAGNMIATAPVAYAMPGAAAESLWGRMLSGLASGAVSGAMQPVDNSGGDYWNQKGMQAGSGAVGGAVMPAAIGAAARTISPETNPNVKLLMKEGVTPTPGQIVGGWFNDLEEKFSSIPGVGDAIKSARRRAVDAVNTAAINRSLSHIGESLDQNTPLGREAISEMHDKIGGAYDNLLPKLTWQADPQFVNNVTSIRANTNLLPDLQTKFDKEPQNQFGKVSPNGVMPGQTYKDVESKLRELASNYSNTQDPDKRELGRAFQQVQAELRAALIRSNPQHAGDLRNIDAAYADSLRVQGAAGRQGAEEGVFSPAQLSSSVRQLDPSMRKGAFARGEARMQDLSDAAKAVLGNKVPDSGTAGRSMATIAALGALGGGGHMAHLPSSVTLPAIGTAAAGMGAYTRPGQATLAALLASRPSVAAPIASVVRRSAPLGSAGLASVLARSTSP